MILCVGEILADLIAFNNNDVICYEKRAGGAPFNVSCSIAKLGGKVSFVGNVGNDLIGKYLVNFASKQNLYKSLINIDDNHNTTLAFVDLDEFGERSFCFYRKNTADYHLNDINDELIKSSNIIHIGSLMISEDKGYNYALNLIKKAKAYNKLISFDINFRSDIFSNIDEAKNRYKEIINNADIVKFSEDEIEIFTSEYVYQLKDKHIFITLGKNGSKYIFNDKEISAETIKVNPIDTTGAGDSFYGAILYSLDQVDNLTNIDMKNILRFANIAGALNTLNKGAIDGLPTISDIKEKM